MNPLTLEWIEKAEGDFATAGRELRARKLPNYDAACFHAQQAAEKYLKAVLQEAGRVVPRTHSLAELLGLCLEIDKSFEFLLPDLNLLDAYAVQYRYPGNIANRLEARSAFNSSQVIRKTIRTRFGLSLEY